MARLLANAIGRRGPPDLARSGLGGVGPLRQLALAALAILLGLGVAGAVVAARNPIYIVGALLGLGIGLAMLRSTQVGLLGFVALATLLPFAVIPVSLGAFKLTAVDVTLSALLIVWLGRLLLRPEERFQTSGVEGFVALYLGLAVCSFLIGTSTSGETTRLFLKMINSILLSLTIVNCVRTRRQLQELVSGFVVGAGGSAILGIVLYVLPHGTTMRLLSALAPLGYPSGGGVLRFIASTDTLRATSTSVDPNVYGAMLMLAAVLAGSQLLAARPLLPRWGLAGLAGCILLALLLSYSRGSWMGLLAGGLVVVLLRYRRPWVIAALAVPLAALALLPSLGLSYEGIGYLSHLVSGFEAKDQAAAMRLGEYKDAFRLISQYPVFGVGFGVAPDVDLYVGVSSIYLLIAEQMGLLGLAAYLLVAGLVLWRGLRVLAAKSPDPEIGALLLGAVAALVSALTAGVFDHHFANLRFPHMVALFWMLIGLTLVGVRLSRARDGDAEATVASS